MFLAEEKYEQAEMLYDPPEKVCGITPNWSRILEKAGVWNVGVLRELLKEDFWTNGIYGIGDQNGKSIVQGMYFAGLIDKDFEAYKEANDRTYYLSKVRQKRMESEEE